MKVTIYHNPRCSKSRQTLELLRERGIEPAIVEYLKTPPDEQTLKRLLKLLHMAPRDLMRKGEKEYKDGGLDRAALSDEVLIRAMVKHPVLIERPIVVVDDKAVLGRPPENILGLLS
jgi:arsenate reductase